MTPYFDPTMIAWLERGGVLALANLRGGGEYGEAWHQVAMREHEQVVYDDFIAAAEWLTASKHTSAARLGIYGTSGGGMLVAAVTMQRPERRPSCFASRPPRGTAAGPRCREGSIRARSSCRSSRGAWGWSRSSNAEGDWRARHRCAPARPPASGGLRTDREVVHDGGQMVHLNDDFEGGEAELPEQGGAIAPRAGAALLFQHMLLHAGTRVRWALVLPRLLAISCSP